MAWPVDLLEVELFAETAVPDLHQQRLVQIEELVCFVIICQVCLLAQIFLGRHAGGRVDWTSLGVYNNTVLFEFLLALGGRRQRHNVGWRVALSDGLHNPFCRNEANVIVVKYFPSRFRVCVGHFIVHNVLDVLSAILEDEVSSAGVVFNERCDVVDFCSHGDIAGLGCVVRGDVGLRKGW